MLKSSQIMQQNCLLKLIFIRMHDHECMSVSHEMSNRIKFAFVLLKLS